MFKNFHENDKVAVRHHLMSMLQMHDTSMQFHNRYQMFKKKNSKIFIINKKKDTKQKPQQK